MDDRFRAGTGIGQPLEEWVLSEARDLADATRRQLDDAKHDAHGYAIQARAYVQDAMERTRECTEAALRRAHNGIAGYGRHGLRSLKHDVTRYTRAQPITALVIAAGTGLLLGWLSATGRR